MQFQVPITIQKPEEQIEYGQKIMLMGSCFTEHIGKALGDLKFTILQNPNGILFDPASICHNLKSYIENKHYTQKDLILLNELWTSWHHHSRYSRLNPEECLTTINTQQEKARSFLAEADWLILTLGSSFSYRLSDKADPGSLTVGAAVANCHRAPADWFHKHMMAITETQALLDNLYHQLKTFNPGLKIIFTISPVRHIRDGVVENNRSKARLIESVHHVVNKFSGVWYFPAYELVIDVLRDYRFYDIDLAHPNYSATEFVMEKFMETCLTGNAVALSQELKKLHIARNHKPFQPETKAHKKFLQTYSQICRELKEKYPFLDLEEEINYFGMGEI